MLLFTNTDRPLVVPVIVRRPLRGQLHLGAFGALLPYALATLVFPGEVETYSPPIENENSVCTTLTYSCTKNTYHSHKKILLPNLLPFVFALLGGLLQLAT
jgi:hypothetical protein